MTSVKEDMKKKEALADQQRKAAEKKADVSGPCCEAYDGTSTDFPPTSSTLRPKLELESKLR